MRHSGLRVVTAAMDRMTFLQPVHVGQLLTVHASVNAAWRTSMEVGVRVTAEDIRKGGRPSWHAPAPRGGRVGGLLGREAVRRLCVACHLRASLVASDDQAPECEADFPVV